MTTRYMQLHQAVREKQPKAILEVGTWNGMRALALLNLSPKSVYYGFDVFEDATVELDRREFNLKGSGLPVKPHYMMQEVENRLTGFDVHLYKGDTNETLKTFKPEVPIDFAWIDGGHSVETIRSDWKNVKRVLAPDAWVFFDDYFSGGIDTARIGCNEIVKDLRHDLLPFKDEVVGGGFTQIVRVYP